MFYEYFDLRDSRSKPSPNTIKSCENNLSKFSNELNSYVGVYIQLNDMNKAGDPLEGHRILALLNHI